MRVLRAEVSHRFRPRRPPGSARLGLARGTLRGEFRSIDSGRSRVLLIETADRLLTTFPPSLSRKAARSLASLGVTLLLERTVVAIDEQAVTVAAPDGSTEHIPARNAIWAAGVDASGLASRLGELCGAEVDRAGRVTVEPDLTLPGPGSSRAPRRPKTIGGRKLGSRNARSAPPAIAE
jgi:NADH dehydrogenase FAD-containing subunit